MKSINVASVIVLAPFLVLSVCSGCDMHPKTNDDIGISQQVLMIEKQPLWELKKGERAQKNILVRNVTDENVFITDVSTSCTCVEILIRQSNVLRQSSVQIIAVASFDKEPNYQGALDIEIVFKFSSSNKSYICNLPIVVSDFAR